MAEAAGGQNRHLPRLIAGGQRPAQGPAELDAPPGRGRRRIVGVHHHRQHRDMAVRGQELEGTRKGVAQAARMPEVPGPGDVETFLHEPFHQSFAEPLRHVVAGPVGGRGFVQVAQAHAGLGLGARVDRERRHGVVEKVLVLIVSHQHQRVGGPLVKRGPQRVDGLHAAPPLGPPDLVGVALRARPRRRRPVLPPVLGRQQMPAMRRHHQLRPMGHGHASR